MNNAVDEIKGLLEGRKKIIFVDYLILLATSGSIVFFDQLTKNYIRKNISVGDYIQIIDWLDIRLVHLSNTGVAFGMFKGWGGVVTVLAFIVAIIILYYYPHIPKVDWPIRFAMCLQLGGAVGNLLDRLQFGEVTDFIAIMSFPVFNVADSSITVGTIFLIYGIWLSEKRERLLNDNNFPAENQLIEPEGSLDE